VNYKPRTKIPVADYLKTQTRFRHLFRPGNEEVLAQIQEDVDRRWERLLEMEAITNKK